MTHLATQSEVTVIGDVGHDIYSLYNLHADRRTIPSGAADVYAPAGALYTGLVLKTLLPDHADRISVIEPVSEDPPQTFVRKLRLLKEFGGDPHYNGDRGVFRLEHPISMLVRTDARGQELVQPASIAQDWDAALFEYPIASKGRLVIVDMGQFGKIKFETNSPVLNLIRETAARAHGPAPSILVELGGGDLDQCVERAELPTGNPRTIWDVLSEPEIASKTCVIVSASLLRTNQGVISKRLSWEQTIEDIAEDLVLCKNLQGLRKFGHLIVRFGISGAMQIARSGHSGFRAWHTFIPEAKDGIVRDPPEDGDVMAKNATIVAAIVQKLIGLIDEAPGEDQLPAAINHALGMGLYSLGSMYRKGFDAELLMVRHQPKHGATPRNLGEDLVRSIISKGLGEQPSPSGGASTRAMIRPPVDCPVDQRIAEARIPEQVFQKQPGVNGGPSQQWRILTSSLDAPDNGEPDTYRHVDRVSLAMAIAKFGREAVLNREIGPPEDWNERSLEADVYRELVSMPCMLSHQDISDGQVRSGLPKMPEAGVDYREAILSTLPEHGRLKPVRIVAPMMKVNKLVTIDRREIESFRAIRNLIKTYIERETSGAGSSKPMSIAVFGPPGGGKSWSVKCIAKNLNDALPPHLKHRRIRIMGFNVAQFRTIDDLEDAFTGVASANNEGETPLVFFDEFDAATDKGKLAWLQYFLAPMEDGQFRGARQTITLGRAIFVFAGGIYQSFEEFATGSRSPGPGSRRKEDGVPSAVRSPEEFADKKGPDFVSRLRGHIDVVSLNEAQESLLPVVRRALVMRGIIEDMGLLEAGPERGRASVDDDVLYALLTMRQYNHGPRSIRAVLQMCTMFRGRIQNSSLPSKHQLDMHVDSEEFFRRLYRGRVRREVFERWNPGLGSSSPGSAKSQNDNDGSDDKKLKTDSVVHDPNPQGPGKSQGSIL